MRGAKGSALELKHGIAMTGIEHILLTVLAAGMARNLCGAIQDAQIRMDHRGYDKGHGQTPLARMRERGTCPSGDPTS